MNTVEALKALYVAMGGTLTDTYDDIAGGAAVSNYALIPDVIAAIAQIAVPAELPAVMGEDDGKVLTVSGGKWVAALPASQLPAVSADDNGDVLKVVDGAWAKASS